MSAPFLLRALRAFAWLIALITAAPIAIALCPVLWPCFPTRGLAGFSFLYGLLAGLIYAILQVRSEESLSRRIGVGAVLGLAGAVVSSVAISDLLGAYDRSKQKWTMAQMRTAGALLKQVHRPVPLSSLGDLPEWRAAVGGGAAIPDRDGWGEPLRVEIRGEDRFVVSCGACGEPEADDATTYRPGQTNDFEADLVFKNDAFFRYPSGIQT